MDQKFLLLTEKNKREILGYMPPEHTLNQLSAFFHNFADCTRLKILSCLSISDLCVNDLAKLLDANQTTISHQLKLLKCEGLVCNKRSGKIIVYTLHKKTVNDVMLTAIQNI